MSSQPPVDAPHVATVLDVGRERRVSTIDCDVHPNAERGIQSTYAYMPEAWRERFIRKRAHQVGSHVTVKFTHPNGSIQRDDARPPTGRMAASDPAFLAADLMEAYGIDRVVLNSLQANALCAALSGAEESAILASAFNDYFVDRWLAGDRRFLLAMTVPSQDPVAAVAEIDRVGTHLQVVAVQVPLLNVLLGDRRWWPIYDAACRHDLPIFIHGSGLEGVVQGTSCLAGGIADAYIERYLGMTQVAEANVVSLVLSGALEKFPGLKFVFAEFGFLWLLPLLWRLDRAWRHLRYEVPWVRRSPIDYVHDHLWFTTQPLDEPEQPRALATLISLLGHDRLCFSSDYPHWDNEMPGQVLRQLPDDARRQVFGENAAGVFRLP